MTEQIYKNLDFNSNEILDTSKVEINQDAAGANDAVRRSQSETIAATAAQGILVTNSGAASNSTAYTSQTMNGFLSSKQDNMSIHASSTAFAEIINGTEIRITRLTTNEVAVDSTSANLAEAIGSTCNFSAGAWTCQGVPLQVGDVLIIENWMIYPELSTVVIKII